MAGIIRYLEQYLKTPVQWIICLIHCNELPLRHLFIEMDGKTSNPNEFKGPIGKAIQSCEDMNLASFEKVEFKFDVTKLSSPSVLLSSDQKYLFDMCCAISTGQCSNTLAKRSPGKLNHARWLTLANRILRLYVSKLQPSAKLRILVQYILYAYAPSFFNIKCSSSVLNGSVHLANMIKSAQFLPQRYVAIVNATLKRNGYFAHPENVLLAMVNDDNVAVRREGWLKIIYARRNELNNGIIRPFQIPEINFDCSGYTEMIDLDSVVLTAPPLLRSIQVDLDSLNEFAASKVVDLCLDMDLSKTPCHTQAVERCIKVVTEASISVTEESQRIGWIVNNLKSRKTSKKFDSKKDFHANTVGNERCSV